MTDNIEFLKKELELIEDCLISLHHRDSLWEEDIELQGLLIQRKRVLEFIIKENKND